MTDNEIISIDEAIRHCETYFERDDLYRKEHKQLAKWLEELKESYNTINRQASKNERLALELDISKALHKEAVAERDFYCHQMIRFESMFKTAKSEAIKEFVERLKEIIYTHMDRVDVDGVVLLKRIDDSIDNLVKEMMKEEGTVIDARAEAIKEFAEKLKRYSVVDNLSVDGKETGYTVYVDDIDKLVKEMTEEEK